MPDRFPVYDRYLGRASGRCGKTVARLWSLKPGLLPVVINRDRFLDATCFRCEVADNRLVKWTVAQLSKRLVSSYARNGGINHLDGKNLPSKRAIALIALDLLRLLFPGFYDEKLLHSSEIQAETAGLLDEVMASLEDEVCKSLEYNPPERLPKRRVRP